MAEIFIVRHAQAGLDLKSYDQLSDNGKEQAKLLGEYFRELEHFFWGQQIPIISRDTCYTEEREEQECIYLHDPDGNLLRITGGSYLRI